MAGSTIYNSTDGPLIIDRAGRVLGARERLEDVDVDASPVAGHIEAGRLVVVDEPQVETDGEAEQADTVEADTPTKPRNRRGATTQEG